MLFWSEYKSQKIIKNKIRTYIRKFIPEVRHGSVIFWCYNKNPENSGVRYYFKKKNLCLAFQNTLKTICSVFKLYIISLESWICKTDVTAAGSKQCIF